MDVGDVLALASGTKRGRLGQEAVQRIERGRSNVLSMAQSGQAVYGVNTGFGPLCDVQISAEQTNKLQYNLLLAHAVGVGEPIAPRLSKIMMNEVSVYPR